MFPCISWLELVLNSSHPKALARQRARGGRHAVVEAVHEQSEAAQEARRDEQFQLLEDNLIPMMKYYKKH